MGEEEEVVVVGGDGRVLDQIRVLNEAPHLGEVEAEEGAGMGVFPRAAPASLHPAGNGPSCGLKR